jgi:tRNA U38,U39,U40 pseudouridine synthase TruA
MNGTMATTRHNTNRHVPWPLDDSILPQLCKTLQGTHDYSVFVHKTVRYTDKSHVMTIASIDFEIQREQRIPTEHDPAASAAAVHVVTARLVFRAKGFRRTMVRNLVGFCVDRCRGAPAFSAAQAAAATTTCVPTATTPPPPTTTTPAAAFLWNDNQLWITFENNNDNDDDKKTKIEQIALMIHAAPASGLCLDHVLYENKKDIAVP